MSKLKSLDIFISTREDFLFDAENTLTQGAEQSKKRKMTFDSLETFNKVLSLNRIGVLKAIARLRPSSVNQLAKLLGREQPHVHKDCKYLEAMGFILLKEGGGAKKQYTPKLSFDYDIIRLKTQPEDCLLISESAVKALLKSA